MFSSRILVSSMRLASKPSSMPSLRTFHATCSLPGAALISPTQPKTTIPSSAGFFKLERQVFVGTLPLLPLSYFVHGGAIDWLITAAIVANCHL